jgi:hypothetical protein
VFMQQRKEVGQYLHCVREDLILTKITLKIRTDTKTRITILWTSLEPNSFKLVCLFSNLCGVTLGTAATTGLFYQPWMIGDGDCGEIGGMKIGMGNRSTRRKPTRAPLCPP